ncbi:MAG: hypothetical protein JWM99_3508 [Verrucomicrobiales bacterium]|nr:hypothetical protein [Verrucomicrobiales bacterium]
MDWTTNPLVALYFAARTTECDDNDKLLNSAAYVLTSEPLRSTEIGRLTDDVITPMPDSVTTPTAPVSGYEAFGVQEGDDERSASATTTSLALSATATTPLPSPAKPRNEERAPAISPFEIDENVIYGPPHVSPRIRAQDGLLLACHQPMQPLEENDYLEIVINHGAHDYIRQRLD